MRSDSYLCDYDYISKMCFESQFNVVRSEFGCVYWGYDCCSFSLMAFVTWLYKCFLIAYNAFKTMKPISSDIFWLNFEWTWTKHSPPNSKYFRIRSTWFAILRICFLDVWFCENGTESFCDGPNILSTTTNVVYRIRTHQWKPHEPTIKSDHIKPL